ncbi:MAG: selenocysteine-specific translation elongation factor [Bacillota bacterium]|nr:selenocysteine-specific translation elongation factor [Bacillota bacterium]
MRPVIIGTAGHVDHGKTTLVKALTGVDTDRLKEEKERGLTIDLGFAPFLLPSGRRAAIVDVPGHERFIKNMLAGVTGIDVVLLVVAADEGIMPQTEEHLDILSLLRVSRGVVVLNKADLVDPEWLDLVREEVRTRLLSTPLANSPIVAVSAVTGEGIPELLAAIEEVVGAAAEVERGELLRLPVDRVFAVPGHGTVVTGTLLGGAVRPGDEVEVLPLRRRVRVRQVQVHERPVEVAQAGERVALNLVGVEKAELARGCVVAAPGLLEPTYLVDVSVRLLPGAPAPLVHRARVRVHIGTSEVMGRVRLIGGDELPPGSSGYAQLFLEEPIVAVRRDLFILRSYSPPRTIGGGSILDAHPPRRRRLRPETLAELKREEEGQPADLVALALQRARRRPPLTPEEIRRLTLLSPAQVQSELKRAAAGGRAVALGREEVFLDGAYYQELRREVNAALQEFHARFPLRSGMPKEELRSRVAPAWDSRLFNFLLERLEREGVIRRAEQAVAAAGHTARASEGEEELLRRLEEELRRGRFSPPPPLELQNRLQVPPRRFEELLKVLLERGVAVRVSPEVIFHQEAFTQARQVVAEALREGGTLEAASLRDRLGTSRKYAIALLEYFDQIKFTRRVGDQRVAGSAFSA